MQAEISRFGGQEFFGCGIYFFNLQGGSLMANFYLIGNFKILRTFFKFFSFQ